MQSVDAACIIVVARVRPGSRRPRPAGGGMRRVVVEQAAAGARAVPVGDSGLGPARSGLSSVSLTWATQLRGTRTLTSTTRSTPRRARRSARTWSDHNGPFSPIWTTTRLGSRSAARYASSRAITSDGWRPTAASTVAWRASAGWAASMTEAPTASGRRSRAGRRPLSEPGVARAARRAGRRRAAVGGRWRTPCARRRAGAGGPGRCQREGEQATHGDRQPAPRRAAVEPRLAARVPPGRCGTAARPSDRTPRRAPRSPRSAAAGAPRGSTARRSRGA